MLNYKIITRLFIKVRKWIITYIAKTGGPEKTVRPEKKRRKTLAIGGLHVTPVVAFTSIVNTDFHSSPCITFHPTFAASRKLTRKNMQKKSFSSTIFYGQRVNIYVDFFLRVARKLYNISLNEQKSMKPFVKWKIWKLNRNRNLPNHFFKYQNPPKF